MESMNVQMLISPSRPWVHFVADEECSSVRDSVDALEGINVHRFDGSRMQTLDDVFDVYNKEFKFPDYFGRNWPAFAEVMTSSDFSPSPVHLTIIDSAEKILCNEPEEISTLLRQLNIIGRYWSNAVGLSREWRTDQVSFNTIICGGGHAVDNFSKIFSQSY